MNNIEQPKMSPAAEKVHLLLMDLSAEIPKQENGAEYLKKRLEVIQWTQEELDALEDQMSKNQVPDIFKAGEAREAILSIKRAELEQLKASLSTSTNKEAGFMSTVKEKFIDAKDWTAEKLNEVSIWPPQKIAAYSALTIGGLGIAYWLYRKFTKKKNNDSNESSENKGGFLRKLMWLPFIGAGAWMLYKMYGQVKGAESLVDGIKRAGQGIKGGAEDLLTAGKNTVATVVATGSGVATGVETTKKNVAESFSAESNIAKLQENPSSLEFLWATVKDGWNYGVVGTTTYFWKQGKEIAINSGTLIGNVVNLQNSKEAFEFSDEGVEFIQLYTETGIIYVSSFGMIDFLVRTKRIGLQGAVTGAAKDIVLWPFQVIKKGKLVLGCMMPTEHGSIIRAQIQTTMRWPQYQAEWLAHLVSPNSEKHMEGLFKQWKRWSELYERVEDIESESRLREVLGNRIKSVRQQLAEGLQAYYKKTGQIPKFIQEVGDARLISQIERGAVNWEQLESVLTKASIGKAPAANAPNAAANAASQANTPASSANGGAPAQSNTPKAPSTSAPTAAQNTAPTAPSTNTSTAANTVDDIELAKPRLYDPDNLSNKPAGIDNVDEVTDIVDDVANARAAGDENKLAELLQDPRLVEAAEAGSEEAKAVVRATSKLGIGLKYGGRTLVGLGIALDAYLIWDNEQQLNAAKEKNDAASIHRLEARRITLSATGGAGLGLLAVPGSVALAIVAPLAIGSITAEKIYAAVEEWDKDTFDWMQNDSGFLLARIEQSVGELNTAHFVSGIEAEKTNTEMRDKLLRAYLAKNTIAQPVHGETPEQYKERATQLIIQKMLFIHSATNGKMDALMTMDFEQADEYADLMMIRQQMLSQNKQPLLMVQTPEGTIDIDLDALAKAKTHAEKIAILTKYELHVKPAIEIGRLRFALAAGQESFDATIPLKELAQIMRHEINKAEGKIQSFDFPSWGDETEKNVVRVVLRKNIEDSITSLNKMMKREAFDTTAYTEYIQSVSAMIEGVSNAIQQTYDNAPAEIKDKTFDKKDAYALLELTDVTVDKAHEAEQIDMSKAA